MCWYKIKYRSGDPSLPAVRVAQGKSALTLESVTDVSIVDAGINKNIEDFSVTLLGLPDDSSHDENKKLVCKVIDDLKSAGWKKYYYPADPRIPGSELGKLHSEDDMFGEFSLSQPRFDPDIELDMQQWLSVERFYSWYLYQDDVRVKLKVQRRDSDSSLQVSGTYLISLEFTSLDYNWRIDAKEEDRTRWQELFPARLKSLQLRREAAEKRARAAGVVIDESYEPPKIERLK